MHMNLLLNQTVSGAKKECNTGDYKYITSQQIELGYPGCEGCSGVVAILMFFETWAT